MGRQKEEFATLTIEIPMDSAGQREAIVAMLQLLSQEWVILHVGQNTWSRRNRLGRPKKAISLRQVQRQYHQMRCWQ